MEAYETHTAHSPNVTIVSLFIRCLPSLLISQTKRWLQRWRVAEEEDELLLKVLVYLQSYKTVNI